MHRFRHALWAAAAVLVVVVAAAVGAPAAGALSGTAVWYVSPSGSDSSSCAIPASPCLTIDGAVSKAAAGDTVEVEVGTYTGSSASNVVTVDKELTLSGGWDSSFSQQTGRSTIDGQGLRRGVFLAEAATITRFEIVNGAPPPGPGDPFAQGSGILLYGPLTLDRSYVHDNGSEGVETTGAPLTITNSTISANQGGGVVLFNFFGNYTITITNSTIAHNTGLGGINLPEFYGPSSSLLTLNNDTITANSATDFNDGGGISAYSGWDIQLQNTIVSGNTAPFRPDIFALVSTVTSGGYNIGTGFPHTQTDMWADPVLGSVADNGGPTPTMALLSGSPAIDAIPDGENGCGSTLTTDQRGATRPQGAGCDIGAFELQQPLYITKNTTLTQDYYSQEIRIATDGVTLDCAGHSVIGAGWDETSQSGDYVGINLSGRSGVTVKNCHVTGFWYGFLADGNGNTFINNTANGNTGWGFQLPSGDNNVLTSNTANDNGQDGFAVGSHTTLIGNTANGNSWSGFTMLDATGSTFTRNTAARNGNAGFYYERAHATQLTNNTATNNLWDGFFLYDSSHNTLAGNTATGNPSHGFFLNGSRANTLTNNTATNNSNPDDWSASGFMVSNSGGLDANDNILRNNTARGNGVGFYATGANGDNPTTGTLLQNNVANNNSGFGIWIQKVENNKLTGNTARDNGYAGLWVEWSSSNVLDRNTSTGNTWFGFGVNGDATTGNVFSNNEVSRNGYSGFNVWSLAHDNRFKYNHSVSNSEGFTMDDGAHDNQFLGNTSTGETTGFRLSIDSTGNTFTANAATNDNVGANLGGGANNNTFVGNTFNNNEYGFQIQGGNDNLLTGNTATGNSMTGFALDEGSGNVLRSNIANSNHENGISLLAAATGNTLERNAGHNNGWYDGYDEGAAGANQWSNNNFGTVGGSAA